MKEMSRLTRSQKKIYDALSQKGYQPEYIKWEPIGTALEMCGPPGGWTVDDEWLGYNMDDALDYIKKFWNHPRTDGVFCKGFPERWIQAEETPK